MRIERTRSQRVELVQRLAAASRKENGARFELAVIARLQLAGFILFPIRSECRGLDLNQHRRDLQSRALPLELPRHIGDLGFEPSELGI